MVSLEKFLSCQDWLVPLNEDQFGIKVDQLVQVDEEDLASENAKAIRLLLNGQCGFEFGQLCCPLIMERGKNEMSLSDPLQVGIKIFLIHDRTVCMLFDRFCFTLRPGRLNQLTRIDGRTPLFRKKKAAKFSTNGAVVQQAEILPSFLKFHFSNIAMRVWKYSVASSSDQIFVLDKVKNIIKKMNHENEDQQQQQQQRMPIKNLLQTLQQNKDDMIENVYANKLKVDESTSSSLSLQQREIDLIHELNLTY